MWKSDTNRNEKLLTELHVPPLHLDLPTPANSNNETSSEHNDADPPPANNEMPPNPDLCLKINTLRLETSSTRKVNESGAFGVGFQRWN
ncbi:hypothetical protein G9P44_005785 [Scheffersomyces stipitis]|nr:hypothetical protein G9P44_005785 [Scheffersomyces stipitis]